MSSENIRAKIADLFKTEFAAANPTVEIDYENQKFTQPSGEPWVRLTIIDGDDYRENIGNDTHFRTLGVVNVQIMVPEKTGTKVMRELVDDVKAIFLDRQVSMTGGYITFCYGELKGPREVAGWYSRSYQVAFRARWDLVR